MHARWSYRPPVSSALPAKLSIRKRPHGHPQGPTGSCRGQSSPNGSKGAAMRYISMCSATTAPFEIPWYIGCSGPKSMPEGSTPFCTQAWMDPTREGHADSATLIVGRHGPAPPARLVLDPDKKPRVVNLQRTARHGRLSQGEEVCAIRPHPGKRQNEHKRDPTLLWHHEAFQVAVIEQILVGEVVLELILHR